MEIMLVGSALNERVTSLNRRMSGQDMSVITKWTGLPEWPVQSADLAAVLVLEDDRADLVDVLFELRQKMDGKRAPVFVVPNHLGANSRAKYLAAGATQVCSPDETDERLVAEVQSAIDLGIVDLNDVRLTLLQPFISASVEAMDIMAGIKARVKAVMRKQEYKEGGDVSGLIYLIGSTERLLACTFPRATASGMTKRVLEGIAVPNEEEMMLDCVGEFANIVAGQVKGRFVHTEFEFDISTPSIVSGTNHQIHYRNDLPSYVLTFRSDVGDFALQLCVRDRETH